MKKRNIFIRYLVLFMLIATMVACSSTPKHESKGEVIQQTTTTTEKPVVQEKRTTTTTTTQTQ